MDKSLSPAHFLRRKTPPHIVTLVLLASLSALAINVYLPSLPSMAAHFDTSTGVMGLSVGIYLGFSAVLQILIGPIGDMIGRRPVILCGTVIFCLATVGCIYAPTTGWFLIFRMLQATTAAAMVLSRAVVRDMVDDPEEAGAKIAYVTMGMAVVPMAAPAIGGFLDGILGWQANFWLLLFAGLLVLGLSYLDLGETGRRSGNTLGQQFAQYPELLTSRRFWGYCLASALGSGTFFAYLGGAPFVGSIVYDLNPQMLGLFFGAPSLGYFVGNYLTARYSARYGINNLVVLGLLFTISGVGMSLIIDSTGHDTVYTFFGFMCFVGLGNGLTIPNATAGMLSVRPHLAGTASGLGASFMIGGGAALSATSGMLLGPGTGATPLLILMELSAVIGLCSILYVIRREKQIYPG